MRARQQHPVQHRACVVGSERTAQVQRRQRAIGLVRSRRHAREAQRLLDAIQCCGNLAQVAGETTADSHCRCIVAEEIEIEFAGEKRVAQIDRQKQQRRLMPSARRVGCGEQEVACRLQTLIQRSLVADPGLQ